MSRRSGFSERLGTKLVVLILICSLVPLGVTTYISVTEAQGALSNSSQAEMAAEVGGVAQNAETRSTFYKSQVSIVRSHPAVRELVTQRYNNGTLAAGTDEYERGAAYPSMLDGTSKYEQSLQFFDEVAAENPNIDMIRVFWRDGNVLAGHKLGSADERDYKADKAWFQRVMNESEVGDDGVYVSAINIARATDSPAIRYAMPIHVDGERVGLVIINYQAKQITAPVTNLDLGSDGYGMLVDPNYTNAEGDRIGAAFVANGRDPSLAFNTSVAGDITIPSGELSGTSGSFTFSRDGRTWYGQYEQVQLAGGRTYYAVAAEPKSQVLAASQSIRDMGLSVGAVSGIAVVGLGLFVTRRLVTSPIRRLAEDAEAIVDGDMDHEIRTSDASSEMARLTSSTRQMKDNVVDALSEAEEQRQAVEQQRREARTAKEQAEDLSNHLESQAQAYESVMRACADGDLTQRMDPESQSAAMTEIAGAFNAMMDDIESTVREIQTFADEVSTASEEASAGAGEIKQAGQEVSRSVQEISSGTDEQREMLETVSEEMNDLSATVEEVASSAQTVADTSRETTEIADAGETTAQEALEASRAVQDAIESTVTHVEALDDQMDEIGEIVELIGNIAKQTNMLALNANIEAAHAGGQEGSANGDGFAVVADEVKQLAGETQESAAKIGQLIEETQTQTSATVEEVRTAAEHMQEGSESVQEVVDAFTRVTENMSETDSGIQEISKATDSQAASAEEAVSMIDEVEGVSQSTADEAESVSAAAEEQASSISQISANVESLAEQAEQLQALLAKFEVEGTRTRTGGVEATARTDVALEDGGQGE